MRSDHILELEGVKKRYGRLVALDSISLAVPKGCVYGLLGPNGAGKTTLIGICCGLVKPDAGTIRACDLDVLKRPVKAASRIGLLAQDASFYPDRSALDNLAYYSRISGMSRRDSRSHAEDVISMVGLGDRMHDMVRGYSHGMLKLLNLAQSFLSDPEIVFLDEPLAGLDPEVAFRVKKVIARERKKRTIIMSSHYLEAVEKICDHVGIIAKGEMLASDKLGKIRKGKSLESAFLDLLRAKRRSSV